MTNTLQPRDETQIIASILAGDAHLFHQLIRPYERSVYVMALSFLKNEADAEDTAQEAFLKAFRNLSRFRGDSKFGTWLISITLNEARTRLRQQKTVQLESIDAPDDPNEDTRVSPAILRDWREIPSETLERKEVRDLLKIAVDALPPAYREIFLLRDVEELSIAETAEVLKINTGLVKVRLHRARIMLQKHLAPQLKQMNPKRRWFPWS
jgi:RNA polymerase sigma-70 factor (ECF subfamily)